MSTGTTATSILNGIVGDYLDASGNELATKMELYRDAKGSPLVVSNLQEELLKPATATIAQNATTRRRLCILMHGLVNDESAWTFPDGSGDYGSFLQRDLDQDHNHISPLYLRYNTGLHVSENGRKFNQLMQELTQSLAAVNNNNNAVTHVKYEIVLICHSMGGLVARSATHHAMSTISNSEGPSSPSWIHQLSTVIFLGTPHHGSYWERAGNVVSSAMHIIPRPYMKLASKVANLRSQGIQDLRYGYVLDEDWLGEDSNAYLTNTKKGNEVLLDWVTYHVATGTVTEDPNHALSRVFGDALVTKSSAQGHSEMVEHHLDFVPTVSRTDDDSATEDESTLPTLPRIREFPGVAHTALQCNEDVYLQIKDWVRVAPPPSSLVRNEEQDESSIPDMEEGANKDICVDDTTTADQVSDDKKEHAHIDIGCRNVIIETSPPLITSPALQPTAAASTTTAKYRGTVTLVQEAVHAGATAVEGVQVELTDEVYNILGKVTPIAPVVSIVHVIHSGIVAGIYGMIRGVNYGAGESMKLVLDQVDAAEQACLEGVAPSQI